MTFSKKKIGHPKDPMNFWQRVSSPTAIKIYTATCVLVIVFFIGRWTLQALAEPTKKAVTGITKVVSKTVGEPLIQDPFGKVNILIAGYAGDRYRGGLLTDTMMVASYDPKLAAVTFLSIPRDLYVNYDNGSYGKLNGLYRSYYLQAPEGSEHTSGSVALMDKLGDITGLDVSYSMFVDFDGFVTFINEIGGVEVDVPESLYDDQYPGPNDSYTVFQVQAGPQNFDGETALKYARSRKSTSDFSRALRQQQIIGATVKQVMSKFSVSNVGNLTSLYDQAMQVVKTDIPLQNLLWLAQFADNTPQFFSFVYTAECNSNNINYAEPGCLLYYGDRSQFGGQAVILPQGSNISNLSNYSQTAQFGSRVSRHQEMLLEKATITVLNGIDQQLARSEGYGTNGLATDFGITLIENGYTIDKVTNAEADQEQTTIVLTNTGANVNTIWSLRSFIDDDFAIVVDPTIGSGRAGENVMQIILGYDYLVE